AAAPAAQAVAALAGAPLPPAAAPAGDGAGVFAKDLMVTVFVPVGRKTVDSVVPYAAVVFDAHGGAWVYLDRTADKAGEHRYERRRVDLGPTVGGGVVVRPPLREGERVVSAGAALLFSREFHKTPVKAPSK